VISEEYQTIAVAHDLGIQESAKRLDCHIYIPGSAFPAWTSGVLGSS